MRLDWARMLLLATAMAFMQVGINYSKHKKSLRVGIS